MQTQTISRNDLRVLYTIGCDKWKNYIKELVIWESTTKIKVPYDKIMEAYNEANPDQRKHLEKFFKIEKESDLYSVKNFSELCKFTKTKELTIKDFQAFENAEKMLAFWQIKIIEKLYNKEWKADFENGEQRKWYPYFVKSAGRWRLYVTYYYYYSCYGIVGGYKDEKIAKFVGTTFIDIYLKVI